MAIRDHLQISPLILNEFKQIDLFPFPLKWSENQKLSDDFKGG